MTVVAPKLERKEFKLGPHSMTLVNPGSAVTRLSSLQETGLKNLRIRGISIGEQNDARKEAIQTELTARVSGIAAELPGLYSQLGQAVGIEVPGLNTTIEGRLTSIANLNRGAVAEANLLDLKFSRVQKAFLTAKRRAETRKDFLNSVLEHQPDASLIDLNCIIDLRVPNGLPALGLYSVSSPAVTYETGKYNAGLTIKHGKAELKLPQKLVNKLAISIQDATGVGNSERKTFNNDKGESVKFKALGSVKLETNFGSKIIPPEAREIIRKAELSGLFDQVLLLAEVPGWKIIYDFHDGKLENTKITTNAVVLVNKDPLIIGTKVLPDGEFVCAVLGAFDVTPLERLALQEWGSKLGK